MAWSYSELGVLVKNTGRLTEAEAAYTQALGLTKHLVAEFASVPRYRQSLANTYNRLGSLLQLMGRLTPAEAAFTEGLALSQQLAAEFPSEPRYRLDLATLHYNLGNLLKSARRPKEAERAYRDALTIHKGLVANFPAVHAYRAELARTYNNLGTLALEAGRADEAEEPFRQALAIKKQLVADFPTMSNYQNDLAGTMVNLASVLQVRKDYSAARELLEQAVPHHEAAMRDNPRYYRQFFENNRLLLGQILVELGDHAGASRVTEQLAGPYQASAQNAYDAACTLSQCISAAKKDIKLLPDKQQELAHNYSDRALAWLRLAVSKGYKAADHMQKDTDLDALRLHPEFQKLLTELRNVQGRR
jgi:tetratricopeptide (TPR) repeat protein